MTSLPSVNTWLFKCVSNFSVKSCPVSGWVFKWDSDRKKSKVHSWSGSPRLSHACQVAKMIKKSNASKEESKNKTETRPYNSFHSCPGFVNRSQLATPSLGVYTQRSLTESLGCVISVKYLTIICLLTYISHTVKMRYVTGALLNTQSCVVGRESYMG